MIFTSNLAKRAQGPELDEILVAGIAELDHYTFLHSSRVQKLALAIGKKMRLSQHDLARLRLGALLHDIGKKDSRLKALTKKNELTGQEQALLESHPLLGWEYLQATQLDQTVKRIILGHHIWANGNGGYPLGTEISRPCLLTQITSVADTIDLLSHPAGGTGADTDVCLEYLEQNVGFRFSHEVVRAFKKLAAAN